MAANYHPDNPFDSFDSESPFSVSILCFRDIAINVTVMKPDTELSLFYFALLRLLKVFQSRSHKYIVI